MALSMIFCHFSLPSPFFCAPVFLIYTFLRNHVLFYDVSVLAPFFVVLEKLIMLYYIKILRIKRTGTL